MRPMDAVGAYCYGFPHLVPRTIGLPSEARPDEHREQRMARPAGLEQAAPSLESLCPVFTDGPFGSAPTAIPEGPELDGQDVTPSTIGLCFPLHERVELPSLRGRHRQDPVLNETVKLCARTERRELAGVWLRDPRVASAGRCGRRQSKDEGECPAPPNTRPEPLHLHLPPPARFLNRALRLVEPALLPLENRVQLVVARQRISLSV